MKLINVFNLFIDLEIVKYLFMAFSFFGVNLCLKKLIMR